jgi:hypothetical protein
LNQLFQVENAEFGGGEGKEENVIVNCTLWQGIWRVDRIYCEDAHLKGVFQLSLFYWLLSYLRLHFGGTNS